MITKHNDKFVLCWHKKSQKWDHVGGFVEKNENPLEAAKRELFEETGAVDFDIFPIFDHESFHEDGTYFNNGRTYFVIVREFSELPNGSEMGKIGFFDKITENFRYGSNSEAIIENFKRIEKLASAHYI